MLVPVRRHTGIEQLKRMVRSHEKLIPGTVQSGIVDVRIQYTCDPASETEARRCAILGPRILVK